ncbi:solute carrier family 35 member G1-like [Ciona intestinalis]
MNSPEENIVFASVQEPIRSDSRSENAEEKTKPKQPFFGFGIICSFTSTIMFTSSHLLAKMVTSVGAIELSGARCLVQFVFLLPYMTYNWFRHGVDIMHCRKTFLLLWIRGFLGLIASVMFYLCVERLPLGDAVTMLFSSIIFSYFFAFIILKERPTVLDIIFSIVIIAGVVLIAQPPFLFNSSLTYDSKRLYGTLFGALGACALGLVYVFIRKLGNRTHPTMNVFYFSFAGMVGSLTLTPLLGTFKLPCMHDVIYLLFVGLLSLSGQILVSNALKYEKTGTIMMIKSVQIVLGFIFQVTILKDFPSRLSIAGSCLVFISIIGIAVKKIFNEYSNRKTKNKRLNE